MTLYSVNLGTMLQERREIRGDWRALIYFVQSQE